MGADRVRPCAQSRQTGEPDTRPGVEEVADSIAALPALVDSPARSAARQRLAEMGRSELEARAETAYAAGVLAVNDRDFESAITWLVRAQSIVDPSQQALIARIAFELGYVHLARAEVVTTEAVIAWAEALLGEHAAVASDLLQLRALVADRLGDYRAAIALYRGAIARSGRALTPQTRVLAMANLAVALEHRNPAESVSLCNLCIAMLETGRVHPGVAPAILNIKGYSLICQGDLAAARTALGRAVTMAGSDNHTIRAFGSFNLAIVDELAGNPVSARTRLEALARDRAAEPANEFVGWIHVRLAWLDVLDERPAAAEARLQKAFGAHTPAAHATSISIVLALIALSQGNASNARAELTRLAATARERGDLLTAFTLNLWCAVVEHRGGRQQAALRAVTAAHAIGHEAGFRVSPNWWSEELGRTARRVARAEQRSFFDGLLGPTLDGRRTSSPASVHIESTCSIAIRGRPLGDDAWREGRTGRRVLQRYFGALVAAHPASLERQALCDELWPDSDGDRAVANLYAATNDLRRVLAAVPGVRVRAAEHRVWLDLDENVVLSILRHDP